MSEANPPRPAPAPCPSNPGIGTEAQLALTSADSVEEVNTVDLAATVLEQRGHTVTNARTHLVHPDSGFTILPQLVEVRPLDDGGVQSVTTVQVNHPVLAPSGLFEYQHSTGDTLAHSISRGFDQWVQLDFFTLLDALLPLPKACMSMVLEFPARDGKPARARRAVFGPVGHLRAREPKSEVGAGPDEHPFCPCCLLTRSFEAFRELLEGDDFVGLRLFAMRSPDGAPEADCRVNGEECEPGKAALREYVSTWPDAGVEFRKQYVVLQNHEGPLPGAARQSAGPR
jgi:hypothetical protein